MRRRTDGSDGSGERTAGTDHADAADQAEILPVSPLVRLLEGADARTILERIATDEDPLDVVGLAHERIHQIVVFLAHDRLVARAFARIAYDAVGNPHAGRPHLHGWLVQRVDRAIEELVREDAELLRQERPFPDVGQEYYRSFSEMTQIPVERVRAACAEFNLLDPITREAFYCVVFELQPIEMYAKSIGESVASVERRIAEATQLLREAQRESTEGRDDD